MLITNNNIYDQNPDVCALKACKIYQREVSNKFPINPFKLAYNISQYESDPIAEIRAIKLENFTAGLFYMNKKNSWLILYNKDLGKTRRNFSIAHELGHYFLHRNLKNHNNNLTNDYYTKLEKEADSFAASLLIPNISFLSFLKGKSISAQFFSNVCKKYNVSLTTAILKWLSITFLDVLLIVAQNNTIIWSKKGNNFSYKSIFIGKNSNFNKVNIELKKNGYYDKITYGNSSSKAIIRIYFKKII